MGAALLATLLFEGGGVGAELAARSGALGADIGLRLCGMSLLTAATVVLELNVVSRTSALTLAVVGTLKEVLTIGVAEEVQHDRLAPTNFIGFVICALGLSWYANAKLCRRESSPSARHPHHHHQSSDGGGGGGGDGDGDGGGRMESWYADARARFQRRP